METIVNRKYVQKLKHPAEFTHKHSELIKGKPVGLIEEIWKLFGWT